MLGTKNPNLQEGATLTKDDVVRIVREYSSVLSNATHAPGGAVDSSVLPHSKQHIKKALTVAMLATSDAKMRAALANAYLSLAEYQPGVGDATLGIDPSKIDLTASVEDQARAILAQSAAVEKFEPMVRAEMEQLTAELKRLSVL